jgi:hypothetical protein
VIPGFDRPGTCLSRQESGSVFQLEDKWDKITTEDLVDIQSDQEKFGTVLQKRYGEMQKVEVLCGRIDDIVIGRVITLGTKTLLGDGGGSMAARDEREKVGHEPQAIGSGASKSDDLTCSEGQIEDLLSEGESTEVERLKRPRAQKSSPKPPSN